MPGFPKYGHNFSKGHHEITIYFSVIAIIDKAINTLASYGYNIVIPLSDKFMREIYLCELRESSASRMNLYCINCYCAICYKMLEYKLINLSRGPFW